MNYTSEFMGFEPVPIMPQNGGITSPLDEKVIITETIDSGFTKGLQANKTMLAYLLLAIPVYFILKN